MSDQTPGDGVQVTQRQFVEGQRLFGRYVLLKILGRGGMGIVWLARDEELERQVALKFLPDMIVRDRSLLNELKRETRRSLELTHKNVIRIYDFVHDETTACISMEYVDGDTLSNLRADKEQQVFEPDEIAGWTAQLCDALDYAHNQARIVHRDLKPSNLMVNQKGDLKVSDFGIARSLGDSVSRLTLENRTSGTLVYMSPQQLDGKQATHLDDVYSLGATLYDLLTSKPPFYSGNIDRQIHDRSPPSMTERRKSLNIEPAVISPLWEQVVSACLEKDPARRPQSTTAVADRLKLGSPRRRRPRAISRPRLNKKAIGVIALTALAGAIVAAVIWQLHSQAEIKNEIVKLKLREGIIAYPQMEAEIAGSREKDALAVQEQVYAQLSKQLGVDAKVLREKLPRFADELRRTPSASTYERANGSYVAMDYPAAERLALQAAEEAGKTKPANSKSILQALELAGLSAQKQIQYDRAMEHFREAEKLTDRNRNLEEWATLQHDIAGLLVVHGKYSDAEKLFRNVIEARARVLGPDHPDTLDSRYRLIYALARQTKYGEAEAQARQVLTAREKVLGPDHPDTLSSRSRLANVLSNEGKNSEAEALYREIIALDQKTLGSEHLRTVEALEGLADVLTNEGKNTEAEAIYREIIALDEKTYGPEHPNTLNGRQNLATVLQAQAKYPAAEAEYHRVISLEEKVIGAEHPDALISRNNLTEVLDDEGKYAEAEAECRQIIGPEQKTLGPENQVTLNTRGNLAVALIGQGKFADAETEYKDVIALMERVLGFEHPDTLNYTAKFATTLSHQNRNTEAMDIATGALQRARKQLGPDQPITGKYAKLVEDLENKK